ncbi:MAG: PilZ domain-containing protein [Desulfobacteraceae bacterium]|nr:PilZ domain-containing protein [Desulfobacteraceae bacterium]
MFWKKEAGNKYKLRFESSDKRDSYRFKPSGKEKFFIIVNSRAFEIFNISAGGIAFIAEYCKRGDVYNFELWLSERKNDFIKGKIEVSGFGGSLCRAKFIDLDENDIERIHKFIFERQIRMIREKKHKKKVFSD